MKDFLIQEGVTIRRLKNEKSRVTCECANPTCKWRLHASPMTDNVTYRIKTYNGDHIYRERIRTMRLHLHGLLTN